MSDLILNMDGHYAIPKEKLEAFDDLQAAAALLQRMNDEKGARIADLEQQLAKANQNSVFANIVRNTAKLQNQVAVVERKFQSGSSVPVGRVTITRKEWEGTS